MMVDETKKTKRVSKKVSKVAAKSSPKPASSTKSVEKAAPKVATNTKTTASKTPVKKAPTKSKTTAKTSTATKSKAATAKTATKSVATKTPKATTSTKQEQKVMPSKTQETKIEPNVNQQAASAQAPVVVKSGGGLGLVSLLLSLGALGLSGYMYMQGMQKSTQGNMEAVVGVTEVKKDVERLDGSISGIQTNLDTLTQGVNKLQSGGSDFVTLSTLEETVTSKLKPVIADQESIQTNFKQISKAVSGKDNSYAIGRVRQLLNSAQYQLDHQADVDGGIQLLTLAGNALQGLKLPTMDNARSKVLAHIDTLQAIETPDLVAVSNKLGALSKDVSNWPLQNEPKAEVIEKPVETAAVEESGFLVELKSVAKQAFNDSFKVQKIGAKPKVLLAPQERYFLDQNLKLKFQSAQTAMLQGQQAIYSQTMTDSKDWMSEYFDAEDARVSDAMADLTAMAKIELKPNLPDISDALGAFDAVAKSEQSATIAPVVSAAATATEVTAPAATAEEK